MNTATTKEGIEKGGVKMKLFLSSYKQIRSLVVVIVAFVAVFVLLLLRCCCCVVVVVVVCGCYGWKRINLFAKTERFKTKAVRIMITVLH